MGGDMESLEEKVRRLEARVQELEGELWAEEEYVQKLRNERVERRLRV